MDRRKFIQNSTLAATGLLTLPSFLAEAKGKSRPVGLQLYSLRDVIGKDPKGVLKSVATWGYTEVETYGYNNGQLFGMPVAEFKSYLDTLGITVVSGHYGINLAESGWEQVCADAKATGQKFVVVPWMDKKYYATLDDLKRTCEVLNKAGEVAKKYKLQMGYHNHAFEFEQVGGKVIFDEMLTLLDPKLVSIEMDIYWVVRAGFDPIAYFEKHPGRFPLWHVKDMDKENKDRNADVGTGSIDFTKLFAQAKKAGLKNYFIEQETYPVNSMQSIENSIKYIKTIR
ncbi:MAG: sugar phosphate isomerase/epimerase [Cytophagales bacterium]|nr:sugar phosphate isomerase/epimerase [Cytophagales bacterium]